MINRGVLDAWGGYSILLLSFLAVAGCVTARSSLSNSRSDYGTAEVKRGELWHCSGYGCKFRKKVSIEDSDWTRLQSLFAQLGRNRSAAEERVALQHAIAELELIVGEKTGTSPDVGGTFQGVAKLGQLDCVDEMLNVASYVDLLIQEKLVIKHRLGERYTNHIFKTGPWPHTATSIVDLTTGEEYVVDSWYLKNGSLPFIITLEEWSEGGWGSSLSPESKQAMENRQKNVR